MKNILLKILHLTTLIIGCILLLTAAVVITGLIVFVVSIIIHEFSNIPSKTWVIVPIIMFTGYVIVYLFSKSPDIIKWSWYKLKNK